MVKKKKRQHSNAYSRFKKRRKEYSQYGHPRLHKELRPVFKRIGVPEHGSFTPDEFQVEALESLNSCDVLVSAPTGAGKTWIASQAIHSYLARDLRVWYASPLKALSNSIYYEFSREFGPAKCGILTGDRKENPEAPVVVGTTEILRNQLYDAMHEGTSLQADLVILDEAHYLNDPERGVVWEEVLIYLPSRVRLLLLSATISNSQELCTWLKRIRGQPNRVIVSEQRPVPLEMLFLFPDGLIAPLSGKKGLSQGVRKFLDHQRAKGSRRLKSPEFGRVIQVLRKFNLLPAIFFLKSRRDCDRALLTCPPVEKDPETEAHLRKVLKDILERYPHLEGHRQMKSLVESKVGAHHGGQLPYWKALVEEMMNKGCLEAIFSTSTVAAGVNFPARTVVLVQSDRFNGSGFTDLTSTEFHQMIGRAGRRGKDDVGFALILPGVHQDPQLIHRLKDSPAEPIRSQIHTTFSMVLNLLLSHTPLEIKRLLERSFGAFQGRGSSPSVERKWTRLKEDLERSLGGGNCDASDPYEVLENIQKRAEIQGLVNRVQKKKTRSGKSGQDDALWQEELERAKESLSSLPCENCPHLKACHFAKKGEVRRLLNDIKGLTAHVEGEGVDLWLSFKRRLRFLKEHEFVDSWDRLTPDGYWASKLRVDQPLLIAEAIRRRALKGVSPEILAGILAPFVWDKAQEEFLRIRPGVDLSRVEERFNKILSAIQGIRDSKLRWGFETPSIFFWPAGLVFLWAEGVPWGQLLSIYPVDEGDVASLVVRTADHLRQVTNLEDTHPQLARAAQEAMDLILREPVYFE